MATEDDKIYRFFARPNRTDQFWNSLSSFGISTELKDLIARMIEYNEEHRLTLADILAHPWMKGEVATHE
jgi:serine/threonine protein kinase